MLTVNPHRYVATEASLGDETMTRENPHIDFAQSYSGENSYLQASIALARCRQLLDDLEQLECVADEADKKKHRVPYFSFEIVSYYAVGFVTCLEWHARSRLVDSVAFNPGLIEAENFQAIPKQTLATMMRENVTVPHVMGALLKISDLDGYSEVFRRNVLEPLGCTLDPRALLKAVGETGRSYAELRECETLISVISELYSFRHHLVHEIAISIVGPYPIRETLTIDAARRFGKATLILMQEVEKQITKFAPKHFPHLLDDNFVPVSEFDVLKARIDALEKAISATLQGGDNPEAFKAWEDAQSAQRIVSEKYDELIEVGLPHLRYIDVKAEVRVLVLRMRLDFLTTLASEVGAAFEPL